MFIIVLETLSREFKEGLHLEMLYADDLVLMAETEELLLEKLRKWKKGMEAMLVRQRSCDVSRVRSENSGKHPCGVCRKRVSRN